MATKCWSQVKGRRMRVTRVDSLGRPVYGVCSTVITGGFVTVNVTSEIEEGAEQSVSAADGTLCISDKADDQLKWLNVEMTFCAIDPDLMLMVNPLFKRLTDYKGDTIGVEESYSYSSTEGIALEVWMDTANVEQNDRYAQGSWLYYLIPYISGGTIGDEEISGSALNLVLRGRTRKGSNWGRGPYNDIQLNPSPIPGGAPVPGPLLTPFATTAPRRRMLVELRPPEPKCGCQPLSNPESGPTVSINEDTTNPANRSTITVRVATLGAYRVDFGDGTAPQDLPPAGLSHAYSTPGTYAVQVWLVADPQKITIQLITVPKTGPVAPSLVLLEDTSNPGTRRTVQALVDNHGSGPVVLDWGDGSAVTVNPGTGTPSVHAYNRDGTFLITATDQDDATRKTVQTVRVPFGQLQPTLTVTEDTADPNRRSVNVVVDNHGNGPVVIEWGDAQQNSANPGDGATVTHHSFVLNATYTIRATDTDDATATASQPVDIPFGNVPPTIATSEASGDPTRMTVSVLVNNHGNGPVTIQWGQAGSANSPNPGDNTTPSTHLYTDDGTYTLTVTDDNNPALTATAQVTVAYGGGQPLTASVVESNPPGNPRRKVTATWDNKGQGPVKINWGDATAIANGAVSGTLDHTYTADGTYTVAVTDASTPAREQTQQVTVPFTALMAADDDAPPVEPLPEDEPPAGAKTTRRK